MESAAMALWRGCATVTGGSGRDDVTVGTVTLTAKAPSPDVHLNLFQRLNW